MIAQFWLWLVLSGLGGGIVGWWARGRKTSGRELKLQREWTDRLHTVEEHANRCLARARQEAEALRTRTARGREADGARSGPAGGTRLRETGVPGARHGSVAHRDGIRPGPRGRTSTRPSKRRAQRTAAQPPSRSTGQPRLPANGHGQLDDLRQIKGIGPVYEQLLHELGYTTFRDVAAWGPAEIHALAERFGARIQPDEWIAQAARLHRTKYGREI